MKTQLKRIALAMACAGLLTIDGCGGGGTEAPAVPRAAAFASTVSGGSGIAVHLYQALYGKAPSYAQLSDYTAQATADASAFARNLSSNFAGVSDAALALQLLNNLNITATTVTAAGSYDLLLAAVGQIFAAYGPAVRGQIILNLTNLLANLESDPTYGVAAASYNSQALANFNYSSIAANTTASTVPTATSRGIAPRIGWEVSISPAIFTYVMQLCYGSQCTPLGGSILMDVDPTDTITVSGTANGISYGDVTRAELQQIIDQGTAALNKIFADIWAGTTTPGSAVIESVFNTALASATTPEDVVSRVISGFVANGFPAAAGTAAGGTGGTAAGGYQCPTTKAVNDPDWVQSHGSYWAAASAHNSYTACLATGSEAACHSYYTLETQYCSYARPACLAVATNASSCPG